MLRTVRKEEERPKAKGDKGTEDEKEDELLREPQGRSVVRKRRRTWRQRGYPAPRQWQKSLRGHILTFRYQTGNTEEQTSPVLSCVDHFYNLIHFDHLIAADTRPAANA